MEIEREGLIGTNEEQALSTSYMKCRTDNATGSGNCGTYGGGVRR